ncbi:early light-induced chloroplastic-like [Micractinium conductrix]|uniref:Early light-induced chloroplastic-like n=1 Tax=Micractinium conductrix TaxID=554055 RepID=A0A2P6V5U9_9CHLO|nr:early light-induced chloroplastic-like [Micractinium conductrix]|eukprot:PSC69459.1 early light-induced chloroplastic-like [Micractinium conductrix]
MRFNGPVPERVNGRLAMLAFMAIAHREMETGLTMLQQALALPHNYAAWPLLALMGLMVYATFPPALAGAREEDFFWFTVRAEKTNGRAAMLGLAVLAALEYHSGFAFF